LTRIDFVTGAPEKYAHLVDRLAEAPVRLRAIVSGRSATDLRRDPGNGDWSVPRILAHMAVMAERNGTFIYQIGTMTDPERLPFDEEEEAGRLQHQNPQVLAETIERELGETLEFLSRTPDASWGRPGRKNGLRRSLRQEVTTHAEHMHEHLDQIEATLAG
jgi:hypothetical protein